MVFILAYAGAAVASLGAWALIGGAALEGRFDAGTLLAWSFLLLSLVPLGIFAMWAQGVFMVGLSGILKMKLMAGALKLDPDETRSQGVGQNFARVLDSNALEALALAGGFSALTAIFDLALAAAILMITSQVVEVIVLLVFVAALVAGRFHLFQKAPTVDGCASAAHAHARRADGGPSYQAGPGVALARPRRRR